MHIRIRMDFIQGLQIPGRLGKMAETVYFRLDSNAKFSDGKM